MEIQELLDEIEVARPGIVGGKVPQKVAAGLLLAAFEVLCKRLDAIEEGELRVKRLGVFHVKQVEKGEGAERVKRKLVRFRYRAPTTEEQPRKPRKARER